MFQPILIKNKNIKVILIFQYIFAKRFKILKLNSSN